MARTPARARWPVAVLWLGAALLVGTVPARASDALAHTGVSGSEVEEIELRSGKDPPRAVRWSALESLAHEPGRVILRFRADVPPKGGVSIPVCAGLRAVRMDGQELRVGPGPLIVPSAPGVHDFVLEVDVGRYDGRVACGEPASVGGLVRTRAGLGILQFPSPAAARGGGQAVVYVPPRHDFIRPGPLLVGAHPWNGSMWTYAAVRQLLDRARARDVLLLFPSGLGNSLYTADAEDEVLRAIDATRAELSIDPRAISIWGASMGGAGATTIAFHHPDRFACATSFFGDSHYDLSTYVRAVLPDRAAAHRVNALDIVDNARNLPVWLVHGEADRTSPIAQSAALASALTDRGFQVRFDRVPDVGHSGALVARFASELVDAAADQRVPMDVSRVTYRSVRPGDVGAYGVTLERDGTGQDAFIDVERRPDAVHVLKADHVRTLVLAPGALGTDPTRPPRVIVDEGHAAAFFR